MLSEKLVTNRQQALKGFDLHHCFALAGVQLGRGQRFVPGRLTGILVVVVHLLGCVVVHADPTRSHDLRMKKLGTTHILFDLIWSPVEESFRVRLLQPACELLLRPDKNAM